MKFIKENYPLIGFLVAYLATKNLVLAAAVWSAGSLLQILTSAISKQAIKKTHIAYFIVGLVLLGLAYHFDNDNFIKWKTSVIVWAGALFLLFRQLFSQKFAFVDLVKNSVEFKSQPPIKKLSTINIIWVLALTSFGFINLYVAYNFSTDFWFYFKLIGLFILLMGLLIMTFIMLSEHFDFNDETENHK